MADARFDILFAGELLAGASADEVRLRIQQRFKLSNAVATRLCDGRTHTIKRDVDTAAASRYREIFRNAGALIEVRPVAASSELLPPSSDGPSAVSVSIVRDDQIRSTTGGSPRQDAPRDNEPSERPPVADLPEIDTSHLSLVSGRDWTLEDCQPPLPPTKLPDTSHLELIMPAPNDGEERGE